MPKPNIYYQVMGDCIGPVDSKEIRQMVKQGTILRDTLIRNGADGNWVSADGVKGLFEQPSPIVDQVPTAKLLTPTKKNCPFCAEEIAYAAIKCKHCGEFLAKLESTPETKASGKKLQIKSGERIIMTGEKKAHPALKIATVFAIMGIIFVFGFPAIFWEDGRGGGNWVIVLGLSLSYLLGGFFCIVSFVSFVIWGAAKFSSSING